MAISVNHSPSVASYAKPLYQSSAVQSYADQLLPFVGQYTQQQFQSGEAEKDAVCHASVLEMASGVAPLEPLEPLE